MSTGIRGCGPGTGGTYSWSIGGPNTNMSSGVFESIQASLGSLSISGLSFSPPQFRPDFSVDVAHGVSGELETPVMFAGTDPRFNNTNVSLEAAAYSAIQSIIEFQHNSPLIRSIGYEEGKPHLAVVETQPDEPPIEYPEEEVLELPDEPEYVEEEPPLFWEDDNGGCGCPGTLNDVDRGEEEGEAESDPNKREPTKLNHGQWPELELINLQVYEVQPLAQLEIDIEGIEIVGCGEEDEGEEDEDEGEVDEGEVDDDDDDDVDIPRWQGVGEGYSWAGGFSAPNVPDLPHCEYVPYKEIMRFLVGGVGGRIELDEDGEDGDSESIDLSDTTLRKKIGSLLQGHDELSNWVNALTQQKLYTSDIRRLALTTKRQIDDVFTRVAANNFALPTGVVDAEVMRIADDELETKYTTAKEVQNEVYEATMQMLTEAIAQSIQIERYHFAVYVRFVREYIETYKINLAIAQAAYNMVVNAYNSAQEFIRIEVDAYNEFIRTQMDQNRAVDMQVDLYEAKVDRFKEELGMIETDVETVRKALEVQDAHVYQQLYDTKVYQVTLRGELTNLQIVKQNIDAFRMALENYSRATEWHADAISSFEAAIQAESSKLSVDEANIRAYKELWSGERTRMSAYRSYIGDTFSVADAELARYRAAASAQRGYLSNISQALADSTSVIEAYRGVQNQKATTLRGYNAAYTGFTEGHDRANMVDAQLSMLQQSLDAAARVEEQRIKASAQSVRVRAAGALAQAASSIHQVSLSATGTATESVDGQDSGGVNATGGSRRSWAHDCISETRAARG